MPKDQWERLRGGDGCPMCADIHLEENEFSLLAVELQQTYVRLPRNQYMRGWTVVALRRHACELFELSETELLHFWQDVALVAKALNAIYKPAKINYAVYGNRCPHIHCHLLVYSYDDDPHKPADMNEGEVLLSDDEYQAMLRELRAAIQDAVVSI